MSKNIFYIPYLQITTKGMKGDTLFKHKESTITYEITMVDAKDCQKLLEPLKKLETTLDETQIKNICGFCHKPGHLKECYHWNPNNPNNKLKDKKMFC